MGKSSSPPKTDYEAAAAANQVNQYTPLGSQTWTPAGKATPATQGHWSDGSSGNVGGGWGSPNGNANVNHQAAGGPNAARVWIPGTPGTPGTQAAQTTTLNPKVQEALDSQLNLSAQMGHLGEQQAGQVAAQGPFDLSSVQDISDKAYGALTSRLDPQWQQREDAERTRLANQGVTYGGEAYGNSMREFNQGRNDAYQQANLAAIQTMPQTYQLASAAYDQPLNRLNALRTGTQVSTPQFGNPNSGALQAAQLGQQDSLAGYNADVASQNAMLSGLFGLGGAGILAFSDRRLKRDIERVAEDPRGFGIYRFKYLWDDLERLGVMADEIEPIMPEAVTDVDGFKAVNYGRLDA